MTSEGIDNDVYRNVYALVLCMLSEEDNESRAEAMFNLFDRMDLGDAGSEALLASSVTCATVVTLMAELTGHDPQELWVELVSDFDDET